MKWVDASRELGTVPGARAQQTLAVFISLENNQSVLKVLERSVWEGLGRSRKLETLGSGAISLKSQQLAYCLLSVWHRVRGSRCIFLPCPCLGLWGPQPPPRPALSWVQGQAGQRPSLSIMSEGWSAGLGAGLLMGVKERGVHRVTRISSSGTWVGGGTVNQVQG